MSTFKNLGFNIYHDFQKVKRKNYFLKIIFMGQAFGAFDVKAQSIRFD